MHMDPVCGMQVDEKTAVGHIEHNGETYYFCSERCQERFEENPERYVTSEQAR